MEIVIILGGVISVIIGMGFFRGVGLKIEEVNSAVENAVEEYKKSEEEVKKH